MKDYLKLAQEIAEESARIAIKYFGFETEIIWKEDNTPLTQADTEINELVINKIKSAYPEHSILGEEQSNIRKDSKLIWVCDPIDGTMPYSCGLPNFTFSLALVDQSDGQPIFGLVNDPIGKHMYWACKGEGAYRNSKKIHVSGATDLKNTYIEIDGSGKRSGFSKESTIRALRDKGSKNTSLLSFIYGGIQVPNGKFSGAIFFGLYAHDSATLKIITEEAGGKVTDLLGKERRYDQDGLGCVASNGILHEEILKCIHKEGNKDK